MTDTSADREEREKALMRYIESLPVGYHPTMNVAWLAGFGDGHAAGLEKQKYYIQSLHRQNEQIQESVRALAKELAALRPQRGAVFNAAQTKEEI